MKIIFAFWPLYVSYNHGVALLSALCKARGIEVDLCILGDIRNFAAQLQRERPQVVGFSCVTVHDYKLCVPFIRAAKALGYTVLLGGVWAGLGHPVDPAVDFVCRGDGETLPDFLLNGETQIFDSPQVCRDIHALPLPDYELFRDIPFDRGLPFLAGKKVLPYQSSRGCNGACTFCQIRHQPRGVRIRTRVGEDLAWLASTYKPDVFFIGDAGLPYANTAWKDSWGDFRHPFFAYIRADIDAESLEWLIDRGMNSCAFGVEAGDETYRNQVLRKNLTDAELWRTVGALERHGVDIVAFFMTGTPRETPDHQRKTRDLAAALPGTCITFRYENLEDRAWAQ
jgi:radical SAM superfamily enzyme YgiQ (UPF0313 family)